MQLQCLLLDSDGFLKTPGHKHQTFGDVANFLEYFFLTFTAGHGPDITVSYQLAK